MATQNLSRDAKSLFPWPACQGLGAQWQWREKQSCSVCLAEKGQDLRRLTATAPPLHQSPRTRQLPGPILGPGRTTRQAGEAGRGLGTVWGRREEEARCLAAAHQCPPARCSTTGGLGQTGAKTSGDPPLLQLSGMLRRFQAGEPWSCRPGTLGLPSSFNPSKRDMPATMGVEIWARPVCLSSVVCRLRSVCLGTTLTVPLLLRCQAHAGPP